MGGCLLWVVFLKIAVVAHIYVLLFPHLRLRIYFDKMYWATLWATFSQTHLVTLQAIFEATALPER
jgi:hypothetical protein